MVGIFNLLNFFGVNIFFFIFTGIIYDHALVFMLKGICRKWKQPICFCKGATSAAEIKRLLVELIKEISRIGLNVIATICDQGATNQSAIRALIQDASRREY